MAKGLSAAKAKRILQDGYIKGKPLTAKQKKYFGAIASGATPLKAINGAEVEKAQWGKILKTAKNLYKGADKFESSIDWAKWNKAIPENKALIKEYNAIEEATKKNGTWMKNSDGSAFNGTPEQFVQQNSKNFKKAFPDGFTKGYRGAKHHIDDFVNRDRNDWATFLTDSKENAVTYAGSDGVPKTYFHPDVDKQLKIENGLYPPQVNGVYELGFPNNLPTVTGNANGKSWRLLDYDSTIEQGIKLDGRVGDHQQSLLNWTEEGFADDYGLQGFNPSARYLTTDNYASYVKNKANKEAVAKIKNVKDQMGYSDILANTVFAVDAERVPLKSLRHNNGMFDMTNSNIYKAIVPGAIGAGAASEMIGPTQADGQFKNGGWLDKFAMGGSLPGASGMMYSRNSGSSAMSPPNLTKAQDGTVEYGTPEYKKAYEEGTFADVPNQLDEVVMYSGVDYEKYPYYNDLSAEQRKYFNDSGSIGRGVRRAAYTKRGLAEDTYDVVNPIMYGMLGVAGGMMAGPSIATLGRGAAPYVSRYALNPIQKALSYKPLGGPVSIGNVVDAGSAAYAGYATPEAYDKFKENPSWDTGLDLGLTAMDLVPFSEILTGGKNIRRAYNYTSDQLSNIFRAKPKGINLETTPLRDAVTQPNIWPTSSPLPKNMEPYLSRKIYPFNKEQEVFESFLSTDKRLENIDSKSLYYDQAGKPITKSEADNLLYPPEYQKNGGDVDKAQWGRILKWGKDIYDGFNTADNVVDVANTVRKTSKVVDNAWAVKPLPGLHLKSTMENGAISKIIEPKTGLINTEQALAIINKESGGAEKVALIRQQLGDNIPKKIDYNNFRKTTQESLIPLEVKINPDGRASYGLDQIGYGNFWDDGKKLADVGILENNALTISNRNQFGGGSSMHGNPDDTLGHVHFLRDVDNPQTLTVTQIQSDAFQGGYATMPKTKEAANFNIAQNEKHLEGQKRIWNSAVQQPDSSWLYPDGSLIPDGIHKLGVQGQESINAMQRAEAANLSQKQLLKKNHQERYLQEIVNYAAQRGDLNKVRIPTMETAAKVQRYTPTSLGPRKVKDLESVTAAWRPEGVYVKTEAGDELAQYKYEFRPTNGGGPSSFKEITEEKFLSLKNEDAIKLKSNIPAYNSSQQSILKKYKNLPKIIKKLYGQDVITVTGAKGNTWYEFDIPESFKSGKGEIKAFKEGGWLSKYENGGVIEDDRGQWAHPGKVTKINSNNITMKGVNYPVLGVSDTGDKKMMQPGKDYKFNGNSVTEYPMAQEGAGVNKEGVKQYKWFKNYMRSPKYKERLKKEFPDYSDNQIGQEVKARLNNVMQTRVGFLPRSSEISTGVGGTQGVYNADEYPGAIMLRPEYSASTSDVLFKPGNYLSGYNTIPLHEWSHAADDGGNRMPQSTTDLMLSKMKENSLGISKDKYYYTRPTEYLGRMQPLRYLMQQEGLYDAGTQDFTKEDLEKAKQNKTIKNNQHFQDLMKNVNSDESFIELMNKVASVDNSRSEYPIAQDGIKTKVPDPTPQINFMKDWASSAMHNKMLDASSSSDKFKNKVRSARSNFDDVTIGMFDDPGYLGLYSNSNIRMNPSLLEEAPIGNGYNSVLTHELSHYTDDVNPSSSYFKGYNIPLSDQKLIKDYSKQGVKRAKAEEKELNKLLKSENMNPNSKDVIKDRVKRLKYLGDPTETRSRINATRYFYENDKNFGRSSERNAEKNLPSIFDSEVTPDMIKVMQESGQYKQLQELYTDDQILEMFNTISDNSKSSDPSNMAYAKEGESLVALDQLTNFTNYNTPQPGGWLDKY